MRHFRWMIWGFQLRLGRFLLKVLRCPLILSDS